MKTIDVKMLLAEHGDLKISEILTKMGRDHLCPKCEGSGSELVLVRQGSYGYTNDIFRNDDCGICEGHGFTRKEMKPKIESVITGYE